MGNLKKHLKTIITWVLLGLLVALWLQFILFPKHKLNNMVAVTAPPNQSSQSTNLTQISSYNIFGSSTVTDLPLNMMQSESTLDLIITGIMASSDPEAGLAYIRNTQGTEKKFKVGDDVFGLAKLAAVHDDHLILSRNAGQREKLSLSKGQHIDTSSTSERQGSAAAKAAKNAASASRISQHIKGSDWQDVLNQQKYDPNKIARIVNNIQVVQDAQGQIAGLRVSQLASGSDLIKQGLRANDQIVSVNGVDISYQNVLSIQNQLQSSADVSVTVMRNGRKMNLNLNLSEFQ